ncbi:MAG: C4-type zinc ribbon domain-containing protein [Verrucomicrobiota bacterium]
MLPEIEKLLILQDRDQRIRTLQTELKTIPLEKKEMETRLAAAATGAEKAKATLRELEVEKKRLEVEAQGKRDQIARFKTQQMQTRKNEEFQAFALQIVHFEREISKIEDRELEIMEAMEAAKPALDEADRKAAEAKARVARQIVDLDAKAATLGEQSKAAEAERTKFSEGIDEDLLDQYNRLFRSKGGTPVVALDHEVCTGCHMKLTAQTLVQVKGERQITHCEQCGRILYLAV